MGFEKLSNLYIILNRDVEDGYYIPKHYSISKELKIIHIKYGY